MLLFRKHKQTVDRLRRMRAAQPERQKEEGQMLSRARSQARWKVSDQRIGQLSHWFPERYMVAMYQPAQ